MVHQKLKIYFIPPHESAYSCGFYYNNNILTEFLL